MNNRTVARFVVMRFNVEFPGYEHLDTNSRDWLDYRLRLAELTAFHSLKLQSLKTFKLVLLVNSATPESFLEALRGATQGLDVIFLQAESTYPRNLPATLLENADAGCMALQTSRLDSDDMFHPDYLRRIDEYCVRNNLYPELAREARYFRFPHGQDYQTHRARYSRIFYPGNAFGTLIEPVNGKVMTVFCDNHRRMAKRFVSYSLDDDRPMWCRIIHGSNLSNKPRKPLPLSGHFPVHPDLVEFARHPAIHPPHKHEPAPLPAQMEARRAHRRNRRLQGAAPGPT